MQRRPVRTGRGSLPDARVLGVDGCRAGWIGVLYAGGSAEVLVRSSFADLVTDVLERGPLHVVGVDIPIGLPDSSSRQADVLARRRLSAGRKSSVFPTPTRAACDAPTWREANSANRTATGGVGVSVQGFGLVPKINDVDAYLRAGAPVPVIEVHPEVSFAAMAGETIGDRKQTPAGVSARVATLRAAGVPVPPVGPGKGYDTDDLLDACAVAWTAQRFAQGVAEPLPDPPELFSDGLPAAIWV